MDYNIRYTTCLLSEASLFPLPILCPSRSHPPTTLELLLVVTPRHPPSNPPSPAAVSPPSTHPTLDLTSPYHRARTLLSFCPFAAFSMSPLTALARLHCLYNLPNRNHNSRRMPARTPHHHPSTVQPHHHRPPLAFALYIRQLSLISQALYDFSRYQFDTVLCKYLHRVSLCASYIRSIQPKGLECLPRVYDRVHAQASHSSFVRCPTDSTGAWVGIKVAHMVAP